MLRAGVSIPSEANRFCVSKPAAYMHGCQFLPSETEFRPLKIVPDGKSVLSKFWMRKKIAREKKKEQSVNLSRASLGEGGSPRAWGAR